MIHKARGKTKDGKWVVGSLVIIPNPFVGPGKRCFILPNPTPQDVLHSARTAIQGFISVFPETVSHSTGKPDKNGDEIFGGMWVKLIGFTFTDKRNYTSGDILKVLWFQEGCCWMLESEDKKRTYGLSESMILEIIKEQK